MVFLLTHSTILFSVEQLAEGLSHRLIAMFFFYIVFNNTMIQLDNWLYSYSKVNFVLGKWLLILLWQGPRWILLYSWNGSICMVSMQQSSRKWTNSYWFGSLKVVNSPSKSIFEGIVTEFVIPTSWNCRTKLVTFMLIAWSQPKLLSNFQTMLAIKWDEYCRRDGTSSCLVCMGIDRRVCVCDLCVGIIDPNNIQFMCLQLMCMKFTGKEPNHFILN